MLLGLLLTRTAVAVVSNWSLLRRANWRRAVGVIFAAPRILRGGGGEGLRARGLGFVVELRLRGAGGMLGVFKEEVFFFNTFYSRKKM